VGSKIGAKARYEHVNGVDSMGGLGRQDIVSFPPMGSTLIATDPGQQGRRSGVVCP
jgi:hypothetical protein